MSAAIKIIEIPADRIEVGPNPGRPGETPEQFEARATALAASFTAHGQRQPVNVTLNGDDKYHVVAGFGRVRAAQIAGLPVRAVVGEYDGRKSKVIEALIENCQRSGQSLLDRILTVGELKKDGWKNEEIADMMRCSKSTVEQLHRLRSLSAKAKEYAGAQRLGIRGAMALLSFKTKELQDTVLEKSLKKQDDGTQVADEAYILKRLEQARAAADEAGDDGGGEAKPAAKNAKKVTLKQANEVLTALAGDDTLPAATVAVLEAVVDYLNSGKAPKLIKALKGN